MQFVKILDRVKRDGFYIIENFVNQNMVSAARDEYFSVLKNVELHPPRESFAPTQLLNRPWRKLAIGSKTGSGEAYSQILQTTYFAECDVNFPVLAGLFTRLIELRNNLTKMRIDYGSNFRTDSFWNACRVHHYPQGGGHMSAHRDTLFPKLLEGFEIPFIQIMLTVSDRGKDFSEGGGFLLRKSGEKYFFETESNSGSLVLFDGSATHGVEEVDLDKVIDFHSPKGRIALFANLYANMTLAKHET